MLCFLQIYPILLRKLVSNANLVEEVCIGLMGIDMKTFLQEAIPIALPSLLLEHASEVIFEIAKRVEKAQAVLCIENSAEILAHVLMNVEVDQLPEELMHLIEITNWYVFFPFSQLRLSPFSYFCGNSC